MSEAQFVDFNGVDDLIEQARKRFVAHYIRVGAIMLVVVTVVWLITVLGAWALGRSNFFALSAIAAGIVYVLACGYFAALVVVTYRCTGLLWTIVIGGAKFNLLLFPPILIIAVGFAMVLDLSGVLRSLVVGLAVYFSAYGVNWVLGKVFAPRDQVEAAAYGDHWLALANVTVRDILLFRIPHERA